MKLLPMKGLFVALLLMAIAGGSPASAAIDSRDPFEGFNRGVFAFNEFFDRWLLRPVAKGYRAATPGFVETGVGNFFSNVRDAPIAVNNLLQGKPVHAASDVGRLVVNSTVGVLGFIDVASRMGLTKHSEDFGQTLGRWGVGSGPYLMLPLLGPSNLRDGPALIVDGYLDPVNYIEDTATRIGAVALDRVDRRAELLDTEALLDEVGGDRYNTIRNAFLENREFQVNDGKVEDLDDLFEGMDEDYEDD